MRLSLLEILQHLIERTYGMRTGIRDLHRFVVGDTGFRTLYASRDIGEVVRSRQLSAAKVLVRQDAGSVFVNIYYPDALIAELERAPDSGQIAGWAGGQPGEQCLLYCALTSWVMGYPDEASRRVDEADYVVMSMRWAPSRARSMMPPGAR